MEEKINLLYNFLYNPSFNNCFDIDKITLGKIGLDDIKVIDDKEAEECLEELNQGKFSYMDYNEKEMLIFVKRYSDTYPITVKIGAYSNNINDLNNNSNNDSLFSYLLSQLVLTKKTNHILLPIVNFDLPFKKIEHLLKNIPIYNSLKEKVEYEEIKDTFSIRIREHFFKSKSLSEYLSDNSCSYKPLLFQLIHTLAVIQKEFPGFRHNNLTLDNVLIYLKKENLSENVYEYNDDNWLIPNIGFDIKITNFEKSVIPKFYGIMNQRDTDVPYVTEQNDYFDLHTFLNSLVEGNNKMSLKNNSSCDLETKKFLDKVIPVQFRGVKNGHFYLNQNVTVVKPVDLLNDSYFKEYKNIKKENSEEKVSGNTYYTNMKKVKMDSDYDSVLGNQKGYMVRKLNVEDNTLKMFNLKNASKEPDNELFPNIRKLKGGAYYENPHVEKPEVLQTNENKKIDSDNTRQLKPAWEKPSFDKPSRDGSKPPYPPRDGNRPPFPPRDGSRPPFPPREGGFPPRGDKPFGPPKPLEPPVEKFETKKSMDADFDEPNIPPGMIPLYDVNNTLLSTMAPYNFVPGQPPIQKIYNISLSDPLGNHSLINRIYEDVLPGDQTTFSFIKLTERETIKNFMRNSILEKYDGEELSLKGGDNSLLSWVKIFDVNPYTLKQTPYEDIPNGFLLYRTAYPIRYSKEEHVIKTTPSSMAFNLRIYKLSKGAIRCLDVKSLECHQFDVWRDVDYYKWVDTIIKRKISPNFINLILHVLDSKSKIGFEDLEKVKKGKNRDVYDLQVNNDKKVNDFKLTLDEIAFGNSSIISKPGTTTTNSIKKRIGVSPITNTNGNILSKEILELKDTVTDLKDSLGIKTISKVETKYMDLTEDSGKLLVALTEAPNNNIIKWNSKVYQSYGTVRKMISTGYHKPEVWRSVLFQLIYACAVMEKEGIYFNNFSLKNNVFIKDVQTDGTGNSCWVYKANNIEYYVPNYGYLVTIDSNYADVTESTSVRQYKIYGKIFKENSDKSEFGKLLKQRLIEEMDSAKFIETGVKSEPVENGLDEEVKKLISSINSELLSSSTISEILSKCFQDLMNNKIGKLLTKLEKENFSILSKPDYREGALMVRQKRYDEYEWVVYVGASGNKKKIISKSGKVFREEEVFSSSLFSYPDVVIPEDKTIIETYTYLV